MNTIKRKNFSLVWGRKLFFGFGWPLLMLIGMGFVVAGEVPETVMSLSLLVMQVLSQTGLLIILGYFFLFYPLVYLIPTYYFSRIWGMAILISLISLYLIDAYSFVLYGVHLNPFVVQHLLLEAKLLEWKAYLGFIPLFIIVVFLWTRGNRIWKMMQRKFMNTNKNWYVWLILLSFLGTQLINIYNQIHYSKYVQNVLEQFPLRIPIPPVKALENFKFKDHLPKDKEVNLPKKKNFYPKALACHGDKNLIFVIYQNAPAYLNHLALHGLKLNNHFTVKADPQNALNSLMYSFPYALKSEDIVESQMIRVLKDYEYHLEFFSTNPEITIDGLAGSKKIVEAKKWMQTYQESSSTQNFALFFYIDKNRVYENTINNLIINLNKSKILDNTIIVLTSLEGKDQEDLTKVPLVFLWKGKEPGELSKLTTGYDVMPTLIQEAVACKGEEKTYSFGKNIFGQETTENFIYTKNQVPYIWIADKNINFSLRELDYFSKDLDTLEVLQLRKFYYNFFK